MCVYVRMYEREKAVIEQVNKVCTIPIGANTKR